MLSIAEKKERRIAYNKVRSIKRALLITPEEKARHAAAERARLDAKRTTPKRPLGVSLAGLSRKEKAARKVAQNRARMAEKGITSYRPRSTRVQPPVKTDVEKKEYRRLYRAAHQDQLKAHRQKRRAMLRGSNGSYTAGQWESLCAQHGHRCLCCKELKPLTVDHVIPLAKGGSNDISNLQPLCSPCNLSKGTKIIDYR